MLVFVFPRVYMAAKANVTSISNASNDYSILYDLLSVIIFFLSFIYTFRF